MKFRIPAVALMLGLSNFAIAGSFLHLLPQIKGGRVVNDNNAGAVKTPAEQFNEGKLKFIGASTSVPQGEIDKNGFGSSHCTSHYMKEDKYEDYPNGKILFFAKGIENNFTNTEIAQPGFGIMVARLDGKPGPIPEEDVKKQRISARVLAYQRDPRTGLATIDPENPAGTVSVDGKEYSATHYKRNLPKPRDPNGPKTQHPEFSDQWNHYYLRKDGNGDYFLKMERVVMRSAIISGRVVTLPDILEEMYCF